jgi:hypothetical protein
MLEYGEAVLVRPIMHYFGEDEDGDVLLPRRLWCKEVVTFLRTQNMSFVPIPRGRKQIVTNLGFAHGQLQVPQACFSSSTIVAVYIPYIGMSFGSLHIPRWHHPQLTPDLG